MMKVKSSGTYEPVHTVTIGIDHQPICFSSGSTITIPGETSKIAKKWLYMIDMAAHNNLPSDCGQPNYATSKA